MESKKTSSYLIDDYPRTLFPLYTTVFLVQNAENEMFAYLYEKVLNKEEKAHFFLQQTKCYAPKKGLHLRRTMKLDPIAELYIYDVVYRHRSTFRNDFSEKRKSFGYRFADGKPISPSKSFGEFKEAISAARKRYKHSLKFDISTYFNSLYHHDLVKWFSQNRSETEAEQFGQFLREIASGRSVDCLPQGLHPSKVIGAEFLKIIDNSFQIKSEYMARFMDDFYLFSDSESKLESDFIAIQRLLGEKGLSLNTDKTHFGHDDEINVAQEIDQIKKTLLKLRRTLIQVSGDVFEHNEEVYENLKPAQVTYLIHLLENPDINESDAELVLCLLKDHGSDILQHLEKFLRKFPSLTRRIFNYCRYIDDIDELASLVQKFISESPLVTEDQLFWMAKIAEEYLSVSPIYGDILWALYSHGNASTISKAKILEIPEHRFGMPELREEHLRVGKSDWVSWAAAVGCRKESKLQRNHLLKYFGHSSPMNHLISSCVGEV